ncbi:MAG TPA: hypothetical protein VN030_10570 [Cellvibrio sp.]|nr:hypothetical protein [Cellvibrio sp.]
MSEQQYNILFRGDIVLGFQLSDVKLRLQQLFKADEAKINALFTGRPVVLKRNLDIVGAEKYRKALLQAGAQVEVVADNNSQPPVSSTAKPAGQPTSLATAARATAARATGVAATAVPQRDLSQTAAASAGSAAGSESKAQDWGLSPVGANLLKPAERQTFVARDIDTSGLQLRAAGGDLLEANERPRVEARLQQVPDFGLAGLGENLTAKAERAAVSNPAVADWGIAEVGADLISEDEREIVLPPLINALDVGVAPAGADLGQIKSQLKPLQPDISKIHLAD